MHGSVKVAARLLICIHKHDESMNPYESTMNPIKKTDESMNPSYLMKKRNACSFLLNSNGFMDSSVLRIGFIMDSYGFIDSSSFVMHVDPRVAATSV